ncbi:F-box only protein 30-like [Genypterus blacodes]|uniref:F-box only protein 30-like n=1 Tax=Genypterus blacodes TaxID=154954 RepID=UPI003F769DF6
MEENHEHCVSCVNHRCMVRPKPGISCDLISCPLVCGAAFHSCKLDEHHLLCQLERVPCLNSGYGCPATLVRNQMSAHLVVCPAGAVCCTMEWNRWPVRCLDYTSYENLSRGIEEVEQLDMALALQDQRTLIESLKVIAMAPTKERESLVSGSADKRTTDSAGPTADSEASSLEPPMQLSSAYEPLPPTPGSAKEKIASGINGLKEEHFSRLYEATVETARSLAAALDIFSSAGASDSTNRGAVERENGLNSNNRELQNGLQDETPSANDGLDVESSTQHSVCHSCLSGHGAQEAQGQQVLNTTNGPLSRPRRTSVDPAGPIAGQLHINAGVSQEAPPSPMSSPLPVTPAVAQRAGHVILEDRGLVLLENWAPEQRFPNFQLHRDQGHCSLLSGQRRSIPDNSSHRPRPKMEDKAVDTMDLEQEDDPMGLGEIDLITAALFFCLEESRECRRISDTIYVDGYHVDFGTQTFTFPAAILVTNTRVGDMASASACDHAAPQLSYPSPYRTLRLGLVLEALEVEAVPHNRYQHTFPFICGQSLRRDQFSSHFTNVHGDIHAGLNGWMEHRCPLAYYGCTFSQRRFYPSTQGSKVVHDRHLRSFGVQPCPVSQLPSASETDHFSRLPFEILWHIAGFLDSFSLCQLSVVSRTMREVCASLLQTRGIVELQWERRQYPVSWQVKNKVWRFSTAFSPVTSWGFTDLPSMSNHLKKCHYNTAEHSTDPVPLPVMCTARDGHSLHRALRHVNTRPEQA